MPRTASSQRLRRSSWATLSARRAAARNSRRRCSRNGSASQRPMWRTWKQGARTSPWGKWRTSPRRSAQVSKSRSRCLSASMPSCQTRRERLARTDRRLRSRCWCAREPRTCGIDRRTSRHGRLRDGLRRDPDRLQRAALHDGSDRSVTKRLASLPRERIARCALRADRHDSRSRGRSRRPNRVAHERSPSTGAATGCGESNAPGRRTAPRGSPSRPGG
jgi:hypothetical protein